MKNTSCNDIIFYINFERSWALSLINMKKKKILLLLCISCSLTLFGCGNKTESEISETIESTEESTEQEISVETETTIDTAELAEQNGGTMVELERPDISDLNYDDYIEVGDYKSLDLDFEKEDVSDEDINSYLNNILQSYAEYTDITDRTTKEGDLLNITFSSTIDGEEFENGAAEDYSFILGSGEFLEDFEKPLYNINTGDIVTADVTFPDDYSSDVAGRTAKFTIVLNSIQEVKIPELTSEIITSISQTASTEEELKNEIKETLELSKEASYKDTVYGTIVEKLAEISTIKDYPENLYNYYKNVIKTYYAEYATAYGLSLEDFLSDYCELTLEDFEKESESYAQEACKQSLILYSIGNKENISLTDEEYEASLEELALEYGYDSVDILKEEISSYNGEYEMRENLYFDKVCEKIVELNK